MLIFRLLPLLVLLIDACAGKHRSLQAKKTPIEWDPSNPRPIIGIVSESVPDELKKSQFKWAQSALFQSYVSFIETGGARATPVFIARMKDFYQHRVNSINGLVVGGEDSALSNPDFVSAANMLFDLAQAANDEKDFFPVLAINAGFAALVNWFAQQDVLGSCSARDRALPLVMTSDYINSQLFHNLPADVNESFIARNVTYNDHVTCLTTQNASQGSLAKSIHVLSTNKDDKGLEFVSTFESIKYPFFGLQWHPERNAFEWSTQLPNIPHSAEAVRASQFIANFFVAQARKSSHHFVNPQEEEMALIPHYNLYYITNTETPMKTLYLFKNNTK